MQKDQFATNNAKIKTIKVLKQFYNLTKLNTSSVQNTSRQYKKYYKLRRETLYLNACSD